MCRCMHQECYTYHVTHTHTHTHTHAHTCVHMGYMCTAKECNEAYTEVGTRACG